MKLSRQQKVDRMMQLSAAAVAKQHLVRVCTSTCCCAADCHCYVACYHVSVINSAKEVLFLPVSILFVCYKHYARSFRVIFSKP